MSFAWLPLSESAETYLAKERLDQLIEMELVPSALSRIHQIVEEEACLRPSESLVRPRDVLALALEVLVIFGFAIEELALHAWVELGPCSDPTLLQPS